MRTCPAARCTLPVSSDPTPNSLAIGALVEALGQQRPGAHAPDHAHAGLRRARASFPRTVRCRSSRRPCRRSGSPAGGRRWSGRLLARRWKARRRSTRRLARRAETLRADHRTTAERDHDPGRRTCVVRAGRCGGTPNAAGRGHRVEFAQHFVRVGGTVARILRQAAHHQPLQRRRESRAASTRSAAACP